MPTEAPPAPPAAKPSVVPPGRMPPPPTGAPPAAPAAAEPKSSRQSMHDRLVKDATPAAEPPPAPNDRTPVADPGDRPGVGDEPPTPDPETPPATAKPGDKPADPPVDKRKNPWKLYEEEKKARAATETELQKLKSERVPEQDRTALTERATKAEARAKELEDHIRFVDYQKSSEFQTKYEQPYVDAWNQAVAELSEITVKDAGAQGGERAVTADDIWTLVNLPLGQAQDVAEGAFGKFASVAMQHRAAIKKLLSERSKAIEDAKKNGGEHARQAQETMMTQNKAVATEVTNLYRAITEEIMNDPVISEFLKPFQAEEGQELPPEQKEWNEFLEKGYKLVDDGWAQNPMKPGLKPEERKAIIQKHAAIRNRAAAFGPLKRAHKRVLKQVAALEKELAAFRGSTPAAGGRRPAANGSGEPQDARTSFHNRLEKVKAR